MIFYYSNMNLLYFISLALLSNIYSYLCHRIICYLSIVSLILLAIVLSTDTSFTNHILLQTKYFFYFSQLFDSLFSQFTK